MWNCHERAAGRHFHTGLPAGSPQTPKEEDEPPTPPRAHTQTHTLPCRQRGTCPQPPQTLFALTPLPTPPPLRRPLAPPPAKPLIGRQAREAGAQEPAARA